MINKISIVATIIFMSFIFYNCSGGNNSSTDNRSTPRRIIAKNVLFRSAIASFFPKNAQSSEIDTTTKVMADNVVVDTTDNALTSNNLQDALDNEMAINLSKLLPETTWTITNKTIDPNYKDSPIGQVTFSVNTFTVDQGKFAAAGFLGNTPVCTITTPISYEMLNNSIMYITWSETCNGYENIDRCSTIIIVAKNKDSISMLGFGGVGLSGIGRISVLTKVQ